MEIKVSLLGDFGHMIEERERRARRDQEVEQRPYPRRVIFVSSMMKSKMSNMGFPNVLRWVEASFIDGDDKVSYKRYVSNTMEIDNMGESHDPKSKAKKHDEAMDKLTEDIEKELEAHELEDVPIICAYVEHDEQTEVT